MVVTARVGGCFQSGLLFLGQAVTRRHCFMEIRQLVVVNSLPSCYNKHNYKQRFFCNEYRHIWIYAVME